MTLDSLRALREAATPGPWRVDPASPEADEPIDAEPPCYAIVAGWEKRHRNKGHFHPSTAIYTTNEHHVVDYALDRDYSTPEGGVSELADARLIALAPSLVDALIEAHEALSAIANQQPTTLEMIEANGFVFDSIGNEPGNWQHLAFSVYTDLCEVDTLARAAVARIDTLNKDAETV